MKSKKQILPLFICIVLLTVVSSSKSVYAEVEEKSPGWDHIISVVAGRGFTVGLRSDGRVAYAGDKNSEEIQKIGSWSDIVRIEHRGENSPYVVGYRSDGSLVLAFLDEYWADSYNEEQYLTWNNNRWKEADFEGWTDIKSLILDYYFALGLRNDGSVLIATRENGLSPEILKELQTVKKIVGTWTSIWQIETYGGDLFRYGIGDYGKVADTYRYEDSGSITCHVNLAVGLKENGEVVSTNNTRLETQSKDSITSFLSPWPASTEWNHVKQLVHGRYGSSMVPFLFAVRENGTVFGITEGYKVPQMDDNQPDGYNIVPYDRVKSMVFAMNEIFILREDGTVYVLSEHDFIKDAEDWTGVVQLAGGINGKFAAEGIPMGLKADGSVLAIGLMAEGVTAWDHIEKLYVGAYYVIGIREDGKGSCYKIDADLQSWVDIVEIIPMNSGWGSGVEHFVGLKRDGTVVAAGDNTYGQCNVF